MPAEEEPLLPSAFRVSFCYRPFRVPGGPGADSDWSLPVAAQTTPAVASSLRLRVIALAGCWCTRRVKLATQGHWQRAVLGHHDESHKADSEPEPGIPATGRGISWLSEAARNLRSSSASLQVAGRKGRADSDAQVPKAHLPP